MKLPLDKEVIIQEIADQINLGLNFVRTRREKLRNNIAKYVDQDKEDGKVGVNTLYASTQLYAAIKYSDEISILAKPRKFWDEEYADNITNLAEYDYSEMNLNRMRHAEFVDEALTGASIRKKAPYDVIRKCPMFESVDPMTWICDPFSDYVTEARWNFFEREIKLSELRELDVTEDEAEAQSIDTELQSNRTYRNVAHGTSDVTDETMNKIISCYQGFTYIEWKLYKVTISSALNELYEFEEVKPVTKEEKKTGNVSMKTVIRVSYFSPTRWDPFGISMADLILDKQKAQSILMNLRLIDAKFNTFGQINLVNTDIVKDTSELTNPSINTKWIGANAGNNSLSNAIYPVPRQSIMADSFNVSQELIRQIQLDTGIDSRSLWVQGDKNITLGESQQIQANANVIFGLWVEVSSWAEVDFWKHMWFRTYQENFSNSDEKFIRLSSGFNTNQMIFRRDDFLWVEDIDFSIESKKKAGQLREQMKIQFAAKLPMILSDPNVPKITKSIAFQYSLKLDGHSRDMQQILNPYFSPEQIDARRQVAYIDAWLMPQLRNPNVELMTYYVICQSAMDSPIKEQFLKNLELAMIEMWQNVQMQNQATQWMANTSASQAQSVALQWQNQPQSLQTIS